MSLINVVIANSHYLTGTALATLAGSHPRFNLIDKTEQAEKLIERVKVSAVDIVILDFTSLGFDLSIIHYLRKNHCNIKILAISNLLPKEQILSAFKAGVHSYILNDCDYDEIVEAIEKTVIGTDFLCGKILHQLQVSECSTAPIAELNCGGVSLTERELDIVKLIAEGHSNKQIADILFLSTHTVNTHRKNIMSKLGVNNTAGLVMYAVKENLLGEHNFLLSSLN